MWSVRKNGADFPDSHSIYPTLTTANASVIATGHGLGDTGDYSNTLYTGVRLSRPGAPQGTGAIVAFLENDETLANMNRAFGGNYLGERTLLSVAKDKGFNVASIGKLGPAAIQLNDRNGWDDHGALTTDGAIVIDDATGQPTGWRLPDTIKQAMEKAGAGSGMPRNPSAGGAPSQGALPPNVVQLQWFTDVATKAILPTFADDGKPFLLLFWSRDPDGSQHNQTDSLGKLTPGINGETTRRGVQNADHSLAQLLAWLDAHPAVKATTDVLVTSDHGFATVSRREIAADGTVTSAESAKLEFEAGPREQPEPKGTLPNGFLGIDLALRTHMRMYDPMRPGTGGAPFAEVPVGGEHPQRTASGAALLGDTVKSPDGSDARAIVVPNGGTDLIYAPSRDAEAVHTLLDALIHLDYVAGIFADDQYCRKPQDCRGSLRLSQIGMTGDSKVPRPAIVVTYKDFNLSPNDLLTGVQVSDTPFREGQGNHGGLGRDQTLNNMAAIGPDFQPGADTQPMGNIDIAPTVAHILGFQLPSQGKNTGRVLDEVLKGGHKATAHATVNVLRSAPAANGMSTLVEYQEYRGVRYLDRACLVNADAKRCPK